MELNKVMAIHDGVKSQMMRNSLHWNMFNMINLKTGYGLLQVFDESPHRGRVLATHMDIFSITPYLTPVDSRWIKFNFGIGFSAINYQTYQATAWGNKYSPDPSIVLQYVENSYKWKTALELETELMLRVTKKVSAGVELGYFHFLSKEGLLEPEGFFKTGIRLTYNLKGYE